MSLNNIVIASETDIKIDEIADISLALEKCLGKTGLLVSEAQCGPNVFKLETRLLGEWWQKFMNYHVAIALVVEEPARYGDRFVELAREHEKHSQIRIISSEAEGLKFLSDVE